MLPENFPEGIVEKQPFWDIFGVEVTSDTENLNAFIIIIINVVVVVLICKIEISLLAGILEMAMITYS